MEVALDGGQGDIDDGDVEDHHELSQADYDQDDGIGRSGPFDRGIDGRFDGGRDVLEHR